MDAVTIIGLAASVVNIVDVIAKSIKNLRDLQQKWEAADWTVNSLITQLSTLSTALRRIETWISTVLCKEPQHNQLVEQLGESLDGCWSLVKFMYDNLQFLDWTEVNNLTSLAKIKAVFHDGAIKECAIHLDRQTNALTLLLTALNSLVVPCGLALF